MCGSPYITLVRTYNIKRLKKWRSGEWETPCFSPKLICFEYSQNVWTICNDLRNQKWCNKSLQRKKKKPHSTSKCFWAELGQLATLVCHCQELKHTMDLRFTQQYLDKMYCLICCQRLKFFLWIHVFLMSSQANGFGKPNITLQDSQCKATSNTTHYILETPLSDCQTTKIPSHPSPVVLYINSVST